MKERCWYYACLVVVDCPALDKTRQLSHYSPTRCSGYWPQHSNGLVCGTLFTWLWIRDHLHQARFQGKHFHSKANYMQHVFFLWSCTIWDQLRASRGIWATFKCFNWIWFSFSHCCKTPYPTSWSGFKTPCHY